MLLLTATTNSFEAKVIAARLTAEGLAPQLRGAVDGPYPFALGGMAEVGVWVPEDQLDDARLVMLAAEVDSAVAERRPVARASRREVVAALVLLGALLVPVLIRVLGA